MFLTLFYLFPIYLLIIGSSTRSLVDPPLNRRMRALNIHLGFDFESYETLYATQKQAHALCKESPLNN